MALPTRAERKAPSGVAPATELRRVAEAQPKTVWVRMAQQAWLRLAAGPGPWTTVVQTVPAFPWRRSLGVVEHRVVVPWDRPPAAEPRVSQGGFAVRLGERASMAALQPRPSQPGRAPARESTLALRTLSRRGALAWAAMLAHSESAAAEPAHLRRQVWALRLERWTASTA